MAEDGLTYCWGDNSAGHLAQGYWSTSGTAVPTAIRGGMALHGLSGGGATCGLAADGEAYCWGDNTLLKLGTVTSELCLGDKACSTVPVPVTNGYRFSLLQSSQFSTCALDAGGTIYCWGEDIDGKFGTSLSPATCVTPNTPAPCTAVPTPGPVGFASLSSGPTTVCGMRSDGGAYCWGGNDFGQLGYPGVTKSMQPVPFSLDPDARP